MHKYLLKKQQVYKCITVAGGCQNSRAKRSAFTQNVALKWAILFVIILMISCNPRQDGKNSNDRTQVDGKNASMDTTSSSHSSSQIPEWLAEVYLKDGEKNLPHKAPTLIFSAHLNDSISYCLFEVAELNCGLTHLVIYLNGNFYKNYEVRRTCDVDNA